MSTQSVILGIASLLAIVFLLLAAATAAYGHYKFKTNKTTMKVRDEYFLVAAYISLVGALCLSIAGGMLVIINNTPRLVAAFLFFGGGYFFVTGVYTAIKHRRKHNPTDAIVGLLTAAVGWIFILLSILTL